MRNDFSCSVSGRNLGYKLVSTLLLVVTLLLPAFPAQAAPPNPRLLKDIYPGAASSYTGEESIVIDGILYFVAADDTHGQELWRSDGTAAGTLLVKDINPGANSSTPGAFILLNGVLFFRADDGSHGAELWRSDGTSAGTFLVKDINPGVLGSALQSGFKFNRMLFFAADDGTHSSELWKSDGTEAGTVLVKDLYPVPPDPDDPGPVHFINVNGTLFFFAARSAWELWKSDGTTTGTVLVKTTGYHTRHPSVIRQVVAVNDLLFFSIEDQINDSSWPDLWRSDGTEAGTFQLFIRYGVSQGVWGLTNFNGILLFAARSKPDVELWRSDGTQAGTFQVKDINPGTPVSWPDSFRNINGTIFITADNDTYGREVWKSDGTEAGTLLVKDIYPGTKSSMPEWLTNVNGTLFFNAVSKQGRELWKSDGTTAGTLLVKDIKAGAGGSTPELLFNANGTLYFTANANQGRELWKSNGAKAGTKLVADIAPGSAGSFPRNFILGNNQLFFIANDGVHGDEWWVLDLTKPTTAAEDALIAAAADAEVPEESISDAEAEAVYQAELAAYEAELAQADEGIADAETLPQKVYLPLITQ